MHLTVLLSMHAAKWIRTSTRGGKLPGGKSQVGGSERWGPRNGTDLDQMGTLDLCVGPKGRDETLMIASDSPVVLDNPATFNRYQKLQCISGDAVHLAFRVEQASGRKKSWLSKLIRRTTVKFRNPARQDYPYHDHKSSPTPLTPLPGILHTFAGSIGPSHHLGPH